MSTTLLITRTGGYRHGDDGAFSCVYESVCQWAYENASTNSAGKVKHNNLPNKWQTAVTIFLKLVKFKKTRRMIKSNVKKQSSHDMSNYCKTVQLCL